MHTKMLTFSAVLIVIGTIAVLPAGASATTLKDTVGGVATTVPKGAKIIGISTEAIIFRAGELEIKCTESSVTGEVTNAGNDVEGAVEATFSAATLSGERSETKCDGGIFGALRVDIVGLPWCLKGGGATDTWTLTGADTCGGNGAFTFILTSSLGTCTFKRVNQPISGTFSTPGASNAAVLTVTGEPEFETEQISTAFCPPGGMKIVKMAYKLYTDKANYTESEANPVWASKS